MREMASNRTAFFALECCTFLDLGGSWALLRIVSRHSVRRLRRAASSEKAKNHVLNVSRPSLRFLVMSLAKRREIISLLQGKLMKLLQTTDWRNQVADASKLGKKQLDLILFDTNSTTSTLQLSRTKLYYGKMDNQEPSIIMNNAPNNPIMQQQQSICNIESYNLSVNIFSVFKPSLTNE